MSASHQPIRKQLMRMVLLTSGAVLLLSTASLFIYDFLTFRQSNRNQLEILGKAIAANSTAALAFENAADAAAVLTAFDADPHIVAAALYDRDGDLFATYPARLAASTFPQRTPAIGGYGFGGGFLSGIQSVVEGGRRLGTLYVRADMGAIDARLRLYGGIVTLVIAAAGLLAYVISRQMQRRITEPVLELARTAAAISTRRDYSVRAAPTDAHELNQLTEAFNHMLAEIQQSEARLHMQLGHLSLLQHITRAIGDRHDLASIFRVVLQNVETTLPIDFGCICQYDADSAELTVTTVGATSARHAGPLGLAEGTRLPAAGNGLEDCVAGRLIHEPDTLAVPFPMTQCLAAAGLRSVVMAPLNAENSCHGVLIAARSSSQAFSSADCEFLKQLSEHVALASRQAQLNSALQQAYDDLRQSQQTVMQQERLRALGQMASGIAHDINNAISPVSLYTESLLEREPNLSERARGYLTTIQRAIDDVAGTVARMREFYRQREQQLTLTRVDLNRLAQQALELTHARWSALPQQRGVMIELQSALHSAPVEVMAAEGEIRDALTNLIFNAVDAMPDGGVLTLRTGSEGHRSWIEVGDSGIGMDEATRRRCLEPFFTTKGERGSGLGLAMVYGTVQRHSAELEIDSEAGRGTRMRLVFAPANSSVAIAGLPSAFPVTVRRLRILLVDDDPMLIRSLEDVLSTDGHQVVAANGGQAGIDAFAAAVRQRKPFDVVITDLGMPHVDGRRVAAAIKAGAPATPVIMLTGWGQRMIAENDVPPHVNRVLSKPPRMPELRAVLAEFCGRNADTETVITDQVRA